MNKQKGFTLIFVLVLLIVISLLVATSFRNIRSETEMVAGEADNKFAFSLNEVTMDYIQKVHLYEVDKKIANGDIVPIDGQCLTGGVGVCKTLTTSIWETNSTNGINVLDDCDTSYSFNVNETGGTCTTPGNISWRNPHYIIELVTTEPDGSKIYRVTVKSWGKSQWTTTTTQTFFLVGKTK